MIDFADEEAPLFRHRAQCKAKEGEIVVTSLRIIFVSNDGSECKQFAWPSIAGVKYSPPNDPKGRAMVLLKTTVKGDEDIIVTLLGSVKEQNFSDLENLKSIVSKLRKSKSTNAPNPDNNKEKLGGVKRNIEHDSSVDGKRRRQLLEHDRLLAKQYKDFVEVSKILTEEDFWASYANHSQQFGESNPVIFKKGKQNSLLADAMSKATNGVINITVELKQNIFAMYPEVRRAFETEVPLKRSETEFWTVYFQSEYYNSTGSTSDQTGRADASVRDDLFARYTENSETTDKSKGKCKLDPLLKHTDIDLTASFGDYRPSESFDASDNLAPQSTVSSKYNRNSTLVLGPIAVPDTLPTAAAKVAAGAGKKVPGGKVGRVTHALDYTKLPELETVQEPRYIQVHVLPETNNSHNASYSTGNEQTKPQNPDLFSKYKDLAGRLLAASHARSNIGVHNDEAATTGWGLPEPQRSAKYFNAELVKMRKQNTRRVGGEAVSAAMLLSSDPHLLEASKRNAHTVGINNSGRSGSGSGVAGLSSGDRAATSIMGMLGIVDEFSGSSGNPSALTDDLACEALLHDHLKQEMLESFTETTELLRHFYTILNRAGNSSSGAAASNSIADKAGAILQRLQEVNAKSLEACKRNVSEKYRGSPEQRDAALVLVNSILLLVQRANVTWEIFKQ